MSIERLSETTNTVYSELLDQMRASASIPRSGSFVSKAIGGTTYWYVQRVDGGRRRQIYLGAETADLLATIQHAEEARAALAEDEKRRRELISMLIAGGMAAEPSTIGSVLSVLADAGLFRIGAVLIGTQAFRAIANLLGVRFDLQADVDVGHPRIAVGVGEMRTDILEDLRASDPRFVAVPELDARVPSTSFKVRGRDLRVDLLTPATRESAKPILLPHLNAAALPMPGLGYLLHDAARAVILAGAGILANVPSPARFALHKLWVAQRRNVSEQAKARKDLRQAAQLLEVLLHDRRADVEDAWTALPPPMLRLVRRSCTMLDHALRDDLLAAVST